jgi:hypothetical protein
LSIRFQADNDLERITVDATLRREPRIDFQTAQAAHLDDLDDEAVLRLAASQSRILVSHDKRTMPKGRPLLRLSRRAAQVRGYCSSFHRVRQSERWLGR